MGRRMTPEEYDQWMDGLVKKYIEENPFPEPSPEVAERVGKLVQRFRAEDAAR